MRTFSMSAPTLLGDVGQLVHEADLGGEHGVGGVLGELGGADVHDDEPVVVADEGLVERTHQLGGARIVGADDDPVGLHEVADRRALLQEFGIGDDVELDLGAALPRACASSSARTLSAVPTGTVDLVMTTQ